MANPRREREGSTVDHDMHLDLALEICKNVLEERSSAYSI